jgi:DNA-binding MarR family transcriptional regulator
VISSPGTSSRPGSVSELLDQLESSGLIRVAGDPGARDGTRAELTVDGGRLRGSLRQSIGRLTARIVGDLDPHDVDVTIRTLRQVTDRAQSLRRSETVSA